MNISANPVDVAKLIGVRIAYARNAANLSQDAVSERLGFGDRQILSSIENGARKVQAAELAQMSEMLGRPVEWFIDPFVIAGEGRFSWRVDRALDKTELQGFEERTGKWIGLLRFLRSTDASEPKLFSKTLAVDQRTSFEEAASMGETVAKLLDLGKIPAEKLVDKIEEHLDMPVIYFDGRPSVGDISGAMCKMRDLRVILINRSEPAVRRSFDVAHELFHALTWDVLTPEHQEKSSSSAGSKGTKSAAHRIERLADNFAAGLLMPSKVLEGVIEPTLSADIDHLTSVADVLQVSCSSLAYRLLNLNLINEETCKALRSKHGKRPPEIAPKRFSASFVRMIAKGIDAGLVSSRKVALALGVTLSDLAALFEEHDQKVSFLT